MHVTVCHRYANPGSEDHVNLPRGQNQDQKSVQVPGGAFQGLQGRESFLREPGSSPGEDDRNRRARPVSREQEWPLA